MENIDSIFLGVKRVTLAHKCLWTAGQLSDFRRGRKIYGISMAVSGSAEYCFTNGKTVTVCAGDVMFLSSADAYIARATEEYLHYTVNFAADEESISRDFSSFFKMTAKDGIESLFSKAADIWQKKQLCYEMRAISVLYELLSRLIRQSRLSEQSREPLYPSLLPAKEYIENNFKSEVKISTLAALCNMSETTFRRGFRRVFGEAPIEYRDRLRLLYACDLLSEGICTVSEISERAGFCDVGYFCRHFKSHMGVSPGKYGKI